MKFNLISTIVRQLLVVSLTLLAFSSCNDLDFTDNPNDRISFSTDTLTFDTVFSTIGSANARILVYNRNSKAIKISDIRLGGGASSAFKLNVDGTKSHDNHFRDLEIYRKDSMYIFVSVTVDPQNVNSPVLIEDSLSFVANGVTQKVYLQAYGQDMILFKNKYVLNDTTLTADKPYLIRGYLAIDTAKTLTLKAGTRLYFHNNAKLVVYGNLRANGTAGQPVLMRGDRLDKVPFTRPIPYNSVAGQWDGVYLLWKGGSHQLSHVVINSAYVGLYCVNGDRNYALPDLTISNSIIHNMVYYGVIAQNANLTITNSEISNTGSYSLYLAGGTHRIIQSTIANYYSGGWQPSSRDGYPAVMMMELERVAPMTTVFRNCVITGSSENEFSIASKFPEQYDGVFDHCYIRKTEASTLSQFTNIRWYERNDTVFKRISYDYEKGLYYNFTPDSVSPLRGLADPAVIKQYKLQYDLNGNLRDDKPDAGAYEWMPTK